MFLLLHNDRPYESVFSAKNTAFIETPASNSNFGVGGTHSPLGSMLIPASQGYAATRAPALLGHSKYSGCYEPAADAKIRIAEHLHFPIVKVRLNTYTTSRIKNSFQSNAPYP
jgi:hypothetical protein